MQFTNRSNLILKLCIKAIFEFINLHICKLTFLSIIKQYREIVICYEVNFTTLYV